MLFDGAAIWFSSRSGIDRLQESELRHWGENEHMNSEVCFDVAKGTDGKIWAATSAGVGRFDGTDWRFVGDGEGGASATRAVVNDGGGRMWLATSRGLRVLDEAAASAPGSGFGVGGELIVEDDMHDLIVDWFGRVWALGDAALAIVSTSGGTTGGATPASTSAPAETRVETAGGTR